jgi:coat protein Gp5
VANTYLTISMITREALRVLENNLSFTKGVNREYDNRFGVDGAKIGDTLNIRKPPRYQGRTGPNMVIEDATETSVALKLDKQFGVDLTFAASDLLLNIDDFSERFLNPAVSRIANEIDFDGLTLYRDVYNTVGTPGTVPNTLLTYLQAGQKLDEEAAPMDARRTLALSPAMQVTIVDALKGLFQSDAQIAEQYRRGRMGLAIGFDWVMDQNVNNHKVGPLGGTPLVDGANQTGSALLTKGWTAAAASRLKRGDVFTIANVNAVNPQNGQSTGSVRQFVVTADFSSDGSGNGSVSISPSMVATGSGKTIDALVADGAAITVLGAANTNSRQGMAFHRDAFTLGTADLPLPKGVDMASRVSDKQLGISIRLVRQYSIATDQFPCRMDVLYGWKTIRPELAARIAS